MLMRIMVDARSMVEEAPSGVGFYARELTREMLEHSEHRFVLFASSLRTPRWPSWTDHPRVARVHRAIPSKLLHGSLTLTRRPRLDRFAESVDLFWMPNLHFSGWSSDVPCVLSVHDLSFLRYPRFFTRKDRVWHRAVNGRRLAKNARAVLTDSEHTARDLESLWGVAREKITTIPLGVHASRWRCSPEHVQVVRDQYEITSPYILFMGTVEPRKNVISLLEAYILLAEELPDAPDLVIAGKRDAKGQELYRWVQKLGLSRRVHFLGYVPSSHRAPLYTGAGMFVYPSIYEGFGLPPLEAMACGTPVITSPVSSLPEVCRDAVLYANPYNVEELKRAMLLLWRDEAYRKRLIERGRARAQELSWTNTAARTLALFESLVAPSHSNLTNSL